MGPLDVLRQDKRAASRLSERVGRKRAVTLLEKAQRDLNQRLSQRDELRGKGDRTFTGTQMRVTLAQVNAVLADLQVGMKGEIVDLGKQAAEKAAGNMIKYVNKSNEKFKGIGQRLGLNETAVFDRAAVGTESSILHRLMKGEGKRKKGILQRYGDATVQRFEERLQLRMLAKQPWAEVRNALIAESDFLQQAPAHWAERIVRTETMAAHNRAGFEAIREVNKQVGGGMVKILSATFDSRTGADSYAVHGQIRRPNEAFESWFGLYQSPPNRPNDREVVVPHSVDWPIPASLKWKTDGEVSSRWTAQGNKRAMPSRPKMTTVPLNKFAKG